MRLIDGDALIEKWEEEVKHIEVFDHRGMVYGVINDVKRQPTIEVPGWIPVTERLPIPNERVGNVRKYYLIQNEYGDMMVACYDGEWEQIYRPEYYLDKVVAWMPLPEPFREGGEEK